MGVRAGVLLIGVVVLGCGARQGSTESRAGTESHEVARDEPSSVEVSDAPADAELEGVAVEPELTRDDLLAEAERRREALDGCPGVGELDGRLADLQAAPDERALWHRYALFVALADRLACD